MPSATGTAPPERPVPAPRATNGAPWSRHVAHRRLHLLRRSRQDDRLRDGPVAREAVALVRPELRRLRDDGLGAERALQVGDEAHALRVSRVRRELAGVSRHVPVGGKELVPPGLRIRRFTSGDVVGEMSI